jgi:prophage regulatory protein
MQCSTPHLNISALRLRDVLNRTGLSRASVYRLIAKQKFPKPAKLSERVSAWNEAEIDAWLASKFTEAK